MKLIGKFYADFQTRDEVYQYLVSQLEDQAIKKAFAGESTVGIKEAKKCIDAAFKNLDKLYGPKKDRKPTSFK